MIIQAIRRKAFFFFLFTLFLFTLVAAGQTVPASRPGPTAIGAITRSQAEINRDHGTDVKDFGAKCDGVTDDTTAIQAALSASAGNGRITISGPGPCVISHMVYIPAAAAGTILESTRVASGIGLLAKPGVPAFQMLRTYASQIHIKDLYLDCNKTASTGLVVVNSSRSVFDNVMSFNCTGDANQLNPYAEPVGTTTTALAIGARPGTTVTVATAELAGETLGEDNCLAVVLDYGKANQEFFEFNRSGNTLKQFLPAASIFAHPAGATIQCNGNNDSAILNNLEGFNSGGWGLDIVEGSDNNTVTIRDPTMFGNKAGGEILSGSVGRHIGGHMEGNQGPAVQLGDLEGGSPNGKNGRATFAWTIDPLNDVENAAPSYNAVVAVCDGYSHVEFKSPKEFAMSGAQGPFCPAFQAGVSTLGSGYDNNSVGYPRLTIKTFNGMAIIDPMLGVSFYGPSGQPRSTFGPANADIAGQLNLGANLQLSGNQLNLQSASADGDIAINRSGKPGTPLTLYNGAGVPEVVLNPAGNSSFQGIQAHGLAGSGNRPACLDAAGNIYAGTNKGGVLSCP